MRKPIIVPNTFNDVCTFCLKQKQSADVHYIHKGRNAFTRICKDCAELILKAAKESPDLVELGLK